MLPRCLAGKESLLMLRVGVRSVYALVRTPAYMCTQAGLRCVRVDGLQMMKTVFTGVFGIIFLGMMPIFCFESYCAINIKVAWMWNAVWVYKAGLLFMVNEAAPSCISACHHTTPFFACGMLTTFLKNQKVKLLKPQREEGNFSETFPLKQE